MSVTTLGAELFHREPKHEAYLRRAREIAAQATASEFTFPIARRIARDHLADVMRRAGYEGKRDKFEPIFDATFRRAFALTAAEDWSGSGRSPIPHPRR